jgi:DNA polymerase III psi subunit
VKLTAAFKQRCEAIAVDQRYRLGLAPNDPLPAERLLLDLAPSAQILTPDQIVGLSQEQVSHLAQADDWSAGIVWRDPLRILIHPAHIGARRESDLMHEAGHVLLDHPMIDFSPDTGLPLREPHYEDEAVYLGSCLQIPHLGLKWAVKRGYNCAQIAAHFGASEAMVQFRCNMTGVKGLQ